MQFSFAPDPGRGTLIDHRVRHGAAASLSVLRDAIAEQLPEFRDPMQQWIANLGVGPVRPGVFAVYSDLVEAIAAEDEPACLSALEAIGRFSPRTSATLRGATLVDEDLGEGMAERFARHLDDDPSIPVRFVPVSEEELVIAKQRLAQAAALLDHAAPALAGEIRRLIRDVVFLASEAAPDEFTFHGASTFYLWGALFLNAKVHPDRVSMAEAITHEAAHSLLLGSTFGAPLVENDDSERFASPLREDLRPMDGIVHATYVLARMHYCIERLLASDALSPEERVALETTKLRRRAEYKAGLEVVAAHARFTPTGRALFDGAQRYMSEACVS